MEYPRHFVVYNSILGVYATKLSGTHTLSANIITGGIVDYTKIISDLIQKRKEGDYWDFKREPYSPEKNKDFVKDVICMANSLYIGSKYIIIGVTDDYEVIGVENINKRKTQADYINIIRGCDFAGQIRPEITLESVPLDDHIIELLIIEDRPLKPYFLTNRYMDVKPYHIYMRNGDTNTPKDKSADIYHIEKMWQQRFGLDLNPLERMKYLLMKPNDWFKDIGNVDQAYNKDFPQYRIEFSEPKLHKEVFSYFYPNDDSFIGDAIFMYHTTPLFTLNYIYCDEMRLVLSYPNISTIKLKEMNCFFYYNKSELDGIFLHFLTDGTYNTDSRGSSAPFIFVEDKNELNNFIEFAISNEDRINEIEPSFFAKQILKDDTKYNHPGLNPVFLSKIKKLFDEWKST